MFIKVPYFVTVFSGASFIMRNRDLKVSRNRDLLLQSSNGRAKLYRSGLSICGYFNNLGLEYCLYFCFLFFSKMTVLMRF